MSVSIIRAADFLNGIGVDTHIAYTDGGYADLKNVQSDLAYLGVTNLRDGISDGENGSASLDSYIRLAKDGEKFTFVVGGGTSTTASVQYTLATIERLAAAVPGSVEAVEGPNEINNQTLTFDGVGGLQGAVALQRYLYQTVKSTPALAGVSVDDFTGYSTVGFAAGPDPSSTAGLADDDNQHPYPQGGQAPATYLDPAQALTNEPGTKGKFVYTETGYTTKLSDVNGVDATVQGKYTLDLLMDAAVDGSSGTYLYQLLDAYQPGSPQGDDGYGLFDTSNDPKLAATGIHDLAAILADKGSTASTPTPAALTYRLSGLPSTGNSLEIAKSDGTTDIAVWAEPEIWSEASKSEVAAPTETVTVSLDAAHAVAVYDPLVGTAPIATYASTSSVQLQVTDHPLIVQVAAATASTEGPATTTETTASTATTAATAPVPATPTAATAAPDPVPITAATATALVVPTPATAASSPAQTAVNTSEAASSASSTTSPEAAVPLANTAGSPVPAPVAASVTVHADGSSTVDVQGAGQVLTSTSFDTFLNHALPGNTFVFDPNHGLDIVRQFRVGGTDHDSLSFSGPDFGNSIAEVLRHTSNRKGGALIVDPTTGDAVKLTGITKAQLVANRGDFTLHA